MMNAVWVPSFFFAPMATVALEERITRERNFLTVGKMNAPPPPSSEQIIDTKAMEAHLRQLVLASRRSRKPKSTHEVLRPPVAPQPLENVSMEPAAVVTPPSTSSSSKSSEAKSRTSDRSLDDAAIAFITAAIQTRQMPRRRAIPTSPYRPSMAQAKQELAAKQRRLEQKIAESKMVIEKLSLAHSKQERAAIMKLFKETSRAAEDDRKTSTKPTRRWWPEASWDGIIIVSDDEDDDIISDDEDDIVNDDEDNMDLKSDDEDDMDLESDDEGML